jgi:hypothetical protein
VVSPPAGQERAALESGKGTAQRINKTNLHRLAMANSEMWGSAVRTAGDLAGVFEFDGETGFFYLYEVQAQPGRKVVGAIHIVNGLPDFNQQDISIRWDKTESMVGFFIRSRIWAVFDASARSGFGGNYDLNRSPDISEEIVIKFDTVA